MRLARLITVAALALFGLFALAATSASAEGEIPEILCLVLGCSNELTATFESEGTTTLETLNGTTMTSTTASLTVDECEPLDKMAKDTNLCKDQTITLKGVKSKELACNTEGDPKEVVLALVDVHVASELNAAKTELEPLLMMKILNAKLEALPITIKCVAKVEVKGTLACLLLPGLSNVSAGSSMQLLCKLNAVTRDPETGKCEVLCEWLTETPFEAKFAEKFEDAWVILHLRGGFNKDVFVDD